VQVRARVGCPRGEKNELVEGVGGSGLSDDSEDHRKLVSDETLAPKVVPGVEHVTMPEGGEPDAVQVEAPDDHLGVVAEEGKERGGEEEGRMAGDIC